MNSEKACDHVNWDFLDFVLESKGIGSKWRIKMRSCLSSIDFAIMVNGKPRGDSRPLDQQGNPLSPFFVPLYFLMCSI